MSLRKQVIRLAHSQPHLRPHLLQILTASSCQTLTGGSREEFLDEVWAMYENSYKSIGMHVQNPRRLLSYAVWELCFGEGGKPSSFAMFEATPYGLKATLSGHDGSSTGKAQAVQGLRTKYKESGVYGEVSHKVKDIALAAGAPVVCNAFVPQILGKPVDPQDDGISYARNLAGVGRVVKVLVGNPKGVPTTSATRPLCPQEVPVTTASADLTPDPDVVSHYACLLF